MKESEVKISLLKYINEQYCEGIVALEVPFQFNERRADVVLLQNDELVAFEIKTKTDKTSRLDYQLRSYKKIFDYCYVVCEQENLSEIRRLIPSGIGLIVVGQSIKMIKHSRRFLRHDKAVMADFISGVLLKDLIRREKLEIGRKNSFEISMYLSKKISAHILKMYVCLEFKERYLQNYLLFKEESTPHITVDDLSLLTRKAASLLRK